MAQQNTNKAEGYKGEYGDVSPQIMSPLVEGPHGFAHIPELMDTLPGNAAGLCPIPPPAERTQEKGAMKP